MEADYAKAAPRNFILYKEGDQFTLEMKEPTPLVLNEKVNKESLARLTYLACINNLKWPSDLSIIGFND